MTTLYISTHHCDDLANAYGDLDLSRFDVVEVGKTAKLSRVFANNASLTGKVLLSENRDEPVDASGAFVNCTGLTEFPKTSTGRTRDYAVTNGMFRGCSSLTGFSPWRCSPTLCQRMFYGCSSWDGQGIQGVKFDKTAHTHSMLEICKGVALSDKYLRLLLGNIRDTLPDGAVRRGVHVGHGSADALTMRIMDSISGDVEIIHEGPQEQWDYDFDHQVGAFLTAGKRLYTPTTVSFDGVTGLDGHFTTPYNGCLVSPRWGVFANHYLPPIGFVARTLTGETLTVDKRVNGPGDLGLCRFTEAAATAPVTVLDTEGLHRFMYRQGYADEAIGSGVPVFAFDQTETPRAFEWHDLSEDTGAAGIGPAVDIDAPGGYFRVGDSGSIFFVVNEDLHALAVSEVYAAAGGGTSIGHHRGWIESVTGERLTLGGLRGWTR